VLESLNYYKFILAALNLIILYVVLRKVLFKPVTEFMEKRTRSIQESLDHAAAENADALALKQSYEEQLKTAESRGEMIVHEAVQKASREYDQIIENARKEAEAILEAARVRAEREKEQTLRDIRSQVAGLALAAASKVLEANMDTERNRALVDRFIDEAGAA